MTRSNRLLVLGGVVTLLGVTLAMLVVLTGRPPAEASEAPRVAAEQVSGAVDTEEAPAAPGGGTASDVAAPFEIPEGLEAVALTVDFQRGVAGLVSAGDRVNVYGVFVSIEPDVVADLDEHAGGARLPAVRRVLADVPVLAVTGASHESNGGTPTVVVGLEPSDVEAAVYTHTAESVYLSLVEPGVDASPDTDGVNAGTLGS